MRELPEPRKAKWVTSEFDFGHKIGVSIELYNFRHAVAFYNTPPTNWKAYIRARQEVLFWFWRKLGAA